MSATDAEALEKRAERLVDDREQLMAALIQYRKDHHLTQKDVADRMGVSQPTVAAFEHYDSNPTLATIQRYAMAVEVVLRTTVVDDCGNDTVPSEWSAPVEWRRSVPTPRRPRKTPSMTVGSYSYA